MSRAVLVIDMPGNCGECSLARLTNGNKVMCSVDRMAAREHDNAIKDRPDWCPLRPMLEKREFTCQNWDADKEAKGWNDD